ncbi:MAG: hypothetical protein ABI480_11545 [Chitinophagaceae bacterium]
MTENQKIFNELYQSQGGRIDFPAAQSLQTTADYLRRFYPSLPDVHIDFTASTAINASASLFKGKYFVALNVGTFAAIQDMFTKMLASRDVLVANGNPYNETSEKKLLNLLLSPTGLEFPIPPINPPTSINDPDRAYLASFYVTFALNFILIHEFAHIIRGHVGYINYQTRSATFSEIDYNSALTSEMNMSFFQTLEMDADSMALNRSFLIAEENMEWAKNSGKVEFPIFRDWETFIFHWTFAIYCLFRLFGFENIELAKAKQFKHPPPSIRMGMLISNINTIFIKRNHSDVRKIAEVATSATAHAEEAFKSVSFASDRFDTFLSNWQNKDLSRYMLETAKNWNNVRPLLEPFAFGTLPPLSDINLSNT